MAQLSGISLAIVTVNHRASFVCILLRHMLLPGQQTPLLLVDATNGYLHMIKQV